MPRPLGDRGAAHHGNPLTMEHRLDRVEPLRVARRQEEADRRIPLPRGEEPSQELRLLAVVRRTGDDPRGPRALLLQEKGRKRRRAGFRGGNVELQVPPHRYDIPRGPQGDEPFRILRGLCRDRPKGPEDGGEEPPEPHISGERALRQPAVDDHHGNPAACARCDEVGPDLGLDDHNEVRPHPVEEPPAEPGKVERKEESFVDDAGEGFDRRLPPGERHARDEEPGVGDAPAQEAEERDGREGLPHGYRVNPDGRAAVDGRLRGDAAQSDPVRQVRPPLPGEEDPRDPDGRPDDQPRPEQEVVEQVPRTPGEERAIHLPTPCPLRDPGDRLSAPRTASDRRTGSGTPGREAPRASPARRGARPPPRRSRPRCGLWRAGGR